MRTTCGTVERPAEDEARGTIRTTTASTEAARRRGRPPQATEDRVGREVRESLWLQDVRLGYGVSEIAAREGLSPRRVQLGIARAREIEQGLQGWASRMRDALRGRDRAEDAADGGRGSRDRERLPVLLPLFPVQPLTPLSACPHHGPLREGSTFCCMVCSRSGMDAHPALKRDPRTDPKPERRAPEPAAARQTRKQRRLARQAARTAARVPTLRRAG